jgi:hypothetical protein
MKTNNLVRQILLAAHPVGSYYWSSEATSPAILFGGSWEAIEDKFVYAAGSKAVGTTGGEETHALKGSEMPSIIVEYTNGTTTLPKYSGYIKSDSWGQNLNSAKTSGYSNVNPFVQSGDIGGSFLPHNNMPPYITAYCWRRTA